MFFKVAIPDDVSGSWYSGKVHISLKEGTFEPSSPMRHACELFSLTKTDVQTKPVLFLYTDGGPDHRLTFIAVQYVVTNFFVFTTRLRLSLCSQDSPIPLLEKPSRTHNVGNQPGASMRWTGTE